MASNRLDAAGSCCNGGLADDTEKPDLAGGAYMSAAAEFHRVAVKLARRASDLHDSDDVAVFVTEELQDAGTALYLGEGNLKPTHGCICKDLLVDKPLNGGKLFRCQGSAGKIKGEFVIANKGTLL